MRICKVWEAQPGLNHLICQPPRCPLGNRTLPKVQIENSRAPRRDTAGARERIQRVSIKLSGCPVQGGDPAAQTIYIIISMCLEPELRRVRYSWLWGRATNAARHAPIAMDLSDQLRARGRLDSQSFITEARQAVQRAENLMGSGKVPALRYRLIVAREICRIFTSSFMRISVSPPCTIFVAKLAGGDAPGRVTDRDVGKSGGCTISRQ